MLEICCNVKLLAIEIYLGQYWLLWKTDPNFRWDNGGKEIYKKLQSNPEFKQSAEYKEYIERLRVEDYDFLQDFELLTDN